MLITYLHEYPRQIPGPPPLYSFGYLPHKTKKIDRWFTYYSVSVVTKGNGTLWLDSKTYRIEAPCVLIETPGKQFVYTPDTWWDEYFFKYDEKDNTAFSSRWGFAEGELLMWPIEGLSQINQYLSILQRLSEYPSIPGTVDKMDRLAEIILLESRHHEQLRLANDPTKRIYEAERYIREHYSEDIGLGKLANKFSFTQSSFRRYWNKNFPYSPAQLITNLRMVEARQLLAESDWNIKRIASQLGYPDALYFSRRFSETVGISPRQYRIRNWKR